MSTAELRTSPGQVRLIEICLQTLLIITVTYANINVITNGLYKQSSTFI